MATRRQLIADYGPSPERLRDLAVSWSRLARLASGSGDTEGAAEAYFEMTRAAAAYRQQQGDTPDSLTVLASALEGAANSERSAGDAETAMDYERQLAAVNDRLAEIQRALATSGA